MKVISSKAHGVLDYLSGAALLVAPYLFGFADDSATATGVAQTVGVIVLLQSLMTRYELGVVKVIPFKMHIMMDYVVSLFLAASPFLLGFSDEPANAWMPHVVVGLGYFVASLMTDSEASPVTA